ncbi:unnamed protein product [Cylindrotheca closterium]|uniref:Uncharacterized protein n=1 Tax=Cylindrotheca closterium TaxID=2856 RepID=A0AAD2JJJ8_9STRA|nr:unnamed protein product [Cylindrotheca closterium]
MPNTGAAFPCHSPRSLLESHDGDSLLSLIGSSIQSSERSPRKVSFISPSSSSRMSHSCQSLLELLTAAVDLTQEDLYDIDDTFQLSHEPLPSRGPQQ